MLPKKPTLAILTFAGLVLLLNLIHLLPRFAAGSVIDFHPRQSAVAELPPPPPPTPTPAKSARTARKPPATVAPNLIDEHESLKAFYQALWRTEAKLPGAVTRVLHYGDSPVTADSITADVRSLLQEHFGDAGHGFVLDRETMGLVWTPRRRRFGQRLAHLARQPIARETTVSTASAASASKAVWAPARTSCSKKTTRAWRCNISPNPTAA